MIYFNEICETAAGFGLEVPGEREGLFQAACMSASAQLERLLKELDQGQLKAAEELAITAGAMMAAANYFDCTGGAEPGSCRVGSVTITGTTGRKTAENLRRQAELLLEGYAECGGFYFKGVAG